jgi:GT2 family glycosyltransferase
VHKIDVVIVSYAKDEYCKRLTLNCIESLFLSEETSDIFNVIVVESEPSVRWENYFPINVTTYDAPLPYGYHKFLNFGRKKGESEWVALCNNDLQFTKNWFSEILKANKENPGIISFSPICPMTQTMYGINPHSGIHIGYEIRKQISGWCIVHKREIYDKIGDLDERFYHWFCDNDYSMTLYNKGIYHALVTDSVVIHHDKNIGKTTERVVESNEEMHRLTMGSHSIFQEKWKI